MKILAIETSCDDTCIALIEATKEKQVKFKILSNIISSQVKLHAKYGGVYPTLAKREHQRNLPLALKKALKKTNHLKIDLIAVTVGPGLDPCLWTGVNFAKDLAQNWGLPIVPVNHIEGHIFANFVSSNLKLKTKNAKKQKIEFPAICLVVSGGHTQLILTTNFGKYKILGETRDDAAGECFDKTARMLGLGYPGGPAIAQQAAQWKSQIPNNKFQTNSKFKNRAFIYESEGGKEDKVFFDFQNSKFNIRLPRPMKLSLHLPRTMKLSLHLPRPMIYLKNYDFSFSGLKTAVLYNYQKQPIKIRKTKKYIKTMCQEIQQAIIDVLVYKTIKAAKDYQVKSIILGGGVIANKELQKQFKEKIKKEIPGFTLYIPGPNMCTDNAAMIGITGYFLWLKNKSKNWKNIKANANLKIRP